MFPNKDFIGLQPSLARRNISLEKAGLDTRHTSGSLNNCRELYRKQLKNRKRINQ